MILFTQTANELMKAGSKGTLSLMHENNYNDIIESLLKALVLNVSLGTVPFNINGRKKIDSLDVAEHDGQKYNKVNQIKCDLVLVSGGWSPIAVHLLSHRGVRPVWDPVNLCFCLPMKFKEPITVTGSAARYMEYG